MATTKRELIKRVAIKTDQKQHIAKRIVQTFMDEMIEELAHGNRLEFREFGVFDTIRKKPRLARNPRTGEVVKVPAKVVVHFKVGRLMKSKVATIAQREALAASKIEKTIPMPARKATPIAPLPVALQA